METRSKKRKSINAGETPTPPAAEAEHDSSAAADSRNWSDLPQDLLLPIFLHLSLSIPDLVSFAGVCRSWRSTAASSVSASPPSSRPPLLLSPLLSNRGRRPKWSGPPQCRLQTLTLDKTFRPSVSSKTLRNRCIGCSYGHLIFDAGDKTLLVDVFTGDKISSPNFPVPSWRKFQIGVLTAPVSSESCMLLCVASFGTLFWRLNGNAWAKEEYLRYGQEVSSLAVIGGTLYCLDDRYRLKVVDFDLPASWRTLELRLSQTPMLHGNFKKSLVECNGELLLVVFVCLGRLRCKIDVYKLDSVKVKWVIKEDLGDWCLFVDVAGNSPMACWNPERWGGRSNCIYVAGSGYDGWSVFPLDGKVIDVTDTASALSSSRKEFPGWPSSVWVYPSKLL